MPKNKGKGGKSFRKGKKLQFTEQRELFMKQDGLDYAVVISVLGGGRFEVRCLQDDTVRIGLIRGSLHKKMWISKDDIILISLREFETSKCDIIWKYTQEEIYKLQELEEIVCDAIEDYSETQMSVMFDSTSSSNLPDDFHDSFIDTI